MATVITMTELAERLNALNGAFVGGDLVDIAIVPAAAVMVAMIKNRVRNKGVGSQGQQLAPYSTNPLYASPDKFVKGGFNPQGKQNYAGNTLGDVLIPTERLKSNSTKKNPTKYSRYTLVKPNYTERKTMYLQEGYKELRDVQGLRTDITNMDYSGAMLGDFKQGRQSDDVVIGLTTKESADKHNGLAYGTKKMAGRGEFLHPTVEEVQELKNAIQFRITRLTRSIMNGMEVNALVDKNLETLSNVG